MRRIIRPILVPFAALLLGASLALAQVAPVVHVPLIPPARGIVAQHGMVVAQESRAARIGIEILDRGGNAVDAAVAVGFALAVTYPRAGNIGGGGFMVIHLAKDNRDIAIDYREAAPAAATATMFLDAHGEPDAAKSRDSGLAIGVPGTVAGLALAREKYGSGKLSLADLIAPAMQKAGGIMSKDDLANYRAIERAPVRGSYRGYDIVSMPPSSSGGVHLIEMLNILEGYDLGKLGRGEQSLHTMIEAMKRAYADRAVFMGDPDAVKMPVAGLISKKYAERLRAGIGDKATPAAGIRPGKPADFEGNNTTHFSVIDRDGNAVSNTTTLNFSYGLGLIADGTGVLLNNTLDDFTAKPGAANAYDLVGFNANLPGPGKRPLSSMTPTIVLKDGKPVLVTGSPGGSRIISAVLQVITNVIDFHMPIDNAVTAPRLHHQWQPDEVYAEPGFAPDVLDALEARGHTIVATEPHTSANSIGVTRNGTVGAADTRTRGALAAGY